jgi:flagellum-specific peptidoglycan hydrolase FlgJ
MPTNMQLSFARRLRAAVAAELPGLSAASHNLITAHGAYETGWGVARAYVKGFNFGNITHAPGDGYTGAAWLHEKGDREYKNGKIKRIDQVWRLYPDIGAAVRDYWALLIGKRYAPVLPALHNADAAEFAAALHRCGYYTLPPAEYAARLVAVYAVVTQLA